MKIRQAQKSECREIAEIKKRIWESTYRGIYPDSKIDGYDIKEQSEKFARLIDDKNLFLYVAEEDNNIAAYMCCGKRYRESHGENYEIFLLNVLKEYQGRGIGTALFYEGCNILKSMGANEALIACNKYNFSAQKFYESKGCKKFCVDDDREDKSLPQIYYKFSID